MHEYNADELASLRAPFIELKATLDRRIKEYDESLRRIANLNNHIDQLLEGQKDTSLHAALETNLFAASVERSSY